MKSITNYLISERNHSDADLKQYIDILNLLTFKSVSIQPTEALIKKCAGYIVEEYVKVQIKFANKKDTDTFVDAKDGEYYDFELKGDKFVIKSFEKGSKSSFTTLTTKQQENKDNLIFVFVKYIINGTKIEIDNVSIEDGKYVKYDSKTGRLMK